MTKTLDRRPEIGLDSFDRFFPNQDTLPMWLFWVAPIAGGFLGGIAYKTIAKEK